MNRVICIIPARYQSTRFPGKPLVDIGGKTMIHRVYERVMMARSVNYIAVATDDFRIFEEVQQFGGHAVMTSCGHTTGTERCLEAVDKLGFITAAPDDIVVNVQGDEPFIHPEQINLVVSCFAEEKVQIATLIKSLQDADRLPDENVVKAVVRADGRALYFSRSPIPFVRGAGPDKQTREYLFYKHIGIYAWRSATLRSICALPHSMLEDAEKLEQLRWIENGYDIHTMITEHETIAIDTPSDLLKLSQQEWF